MIDKVIIKLSCFKNESFVHIFEKYSHQYIGVLKFISIFVSANQQQPLKTIKKRILSRPNDFHRETPMKGLSKWASLFHRQKGGSCAGFGGRLS